MARFETPLFRFGEFLVFVAFAFHALNGLRLVITELGYMLGKPQRPIYPYVNSVRRQRPFFIVLMIAAAVLIVLGGADFYFIGY
jgi:succinate dehydrogenase / fumarate reductase cytochrome b subunit